MGAQVIYKKQKYRLEVCENVSLQEQQQHANISLFASWPCRYIDYNAPNDKVIN
jgi:hypothetical protein